MKSSFKKLILASTFLCSLLPATYAQEVQLDRVAVIVNSGVVLESQITDLINQVKRQSESSNQSLPSDQALRVQVTDKLINDEIIMQIGDRMGVQISDAQLDETINNMAKENKLTIEQFRESIISDGLDYDKYRESVRIELVSGEVRRSSVRRRIYISPQEVENLLAQMKEKTVADVEYHLGHILIEFPKDPTSQDVADAKSRAEKVIELLNTGSDFAKIAIASSGDARALEGGDFGWKTVNDMPTLFSEIVDGQPKDTVLGPIRTGLGFSIVKIFDIRGKQVVEVEEVKSRHIILKPSIILSEAKIQSILQGFLDDILAGKADFAELAKEHSEDGTAPRGGDLGWADPNSYDPAFKDMLASLDIDEYSKPFRSSFGWHLAQLTGRRTLDATEQMNENKAYQMIYNQKFGMESAHWMKEKRDEAYIEVFDADSKK